MAYNETISAPKKLSPWESVKKTAFDAYNTATDIGESFFPTVFQSTEERATKKQAQERYPMTHAFSKYINDMPTDSRPLPKQDATQPYSAPLSGGYHVPASRRMNLGDDIQNRIMTGVNDLGVKIDNPAVTKVVDYLVNKFYDNFDKKLDLKPGEVRMFNGDPKATTHESLHGWYDMKNNLQDTANFKKENTGQGVSERTFTDKINMDWNNLKKDDRVKSVLDSIDMMLADNPQLYPDIFKNPQWLASERYAYLGIFPGLGAMMSAVPEVKDIYGDVMMPLTQFPGLTSDTAPLIPQAALVNNLVQKKKKTLKKK